MFQENQKINNRFLNHNLLIKKVKQDLSYVFLLFGNYDFVLRKTKLPL
jgi:hypothetical protein